MYRFLDLLISIPLLVVLSPVLLVTSLLIMVFDGRPIFFVQDRVGYLGKTFKIIKFKSMIVNRSNEAPLQAHLEVNRITRFGVLLRSTHIDELPQLFNVIYGDMSLVGPRPHAQVHDKLFDNKCPDYSKRRAVRPGITGLAQTSGNNGPIETDEMLEERTQFDLNWVNNRTISGYLKILISTAAMVIGLKS